jgi:hypothetical protein
MQYRSTRLLVGLSGFFLLAGPLCSQKREAKPWDLSTYTCETHQKVLDEAPQLARLLGFWAHGYVSGMLGSDVKAKPVSREEIQSISEKIKTACGSDGKKLFADALKTVK